MKIMVTGGAGFIGSHLTDRLINEGHHVMTLDDFSTGNHDFVNPKAELAEVDITDADKVSNAFELFKPEAVFHLAAMIDLRASLDNSEQFHKVNVVGSQNVIKASKDSGVKKIVFASSAAVYGDNQNLPIKESEPVASDTPYGEQKAEIEQLLKESGIKSVILRFANVYGPRQGTVGEGGVIAIFCKRLISYEPIKIFGDGLQSRDFIFVDDIVSANVSVLDSNKQFSIYNVSTAKETTVNEVAKKLLTISDKNAKVEHLDAIKDEVLYNSLDNRLIKQELGWEPLVGLEEGLKRTFTWFKNFQ